MKNLYYIIQTNKGRFEGNNLEKEIEDMIEFFGERDQEAPDIEYIVACDENGDLSQELPENEIKEYQSTIDREVDTFRMGLESEKKGSKAIESDYLFDIFSSTLRPVL